MPVLPYWSPCPESRPQNFCYPKAWFSHACSSCLAHTSKQAPGLLLPAGLGLLCLQYLLWLLEAHTLTQVDPRASTALWAPDGLSPPALLPHGHPQLATQCQDPTTTHASEPEAPHFAILLASGGFPHHRAWRPNANHHTLTWKSLTALSKSGNPAPPLSYNLPFSECQVTCVPQAQKGPALPTVPDHGRVSTSPLKRKTIRIPTEGRKAISYYSESGTRRSASWVAQRSSTPIVPLKSENARFPTGGRKVVTCYSVNAAEGMLPQSAQRPNTSHLASPQENPTPMSKSWNPNSLTKWQSATL
jgi:hypothetical protein